MSNAAVVKLQKKEIAKAKVWMDDNFGESIHLHINDFRADLTNEEFEKLIIELKCSIDELIECEDFSCDKFDDVFLEQILWKRMLDIKQIKVDRVRLSDLYTEGVILKRLGKSRIYRALSGEDKLKNVERPSDVLGQTGAQRIDDMYKSISEDGYDTSKGYIVLFGDDNVIRDGQHRAASLLKLKGDCEVPVLRVYIKNYKNQNVKLRSTVFGVFVYWGNKIKSAVKKSKSLVGEIKKLPRKILVKGYHTLIGMRNKLYGITHKKQTRYIKEILEHR